MFQVFGVHKGGEKYFGLFHHFLKIHIANGYCFLTALTGTDGYHPRVLFQREPEYVGDYRFRGDPPTNTITPVQAARNTIFSRTRISVLTYTADCLVEWVD